MRTLLIALAFAGALAAQVVTTVSDTLLDARHKPVTGIITLEWPAFTTAAGIYVAPGRAMVPVLKGVLAVAISPTDTATPTFTYRASYAFQNYQRAAETWTVCSSVTPVPISALLGTVACGGGSVVTPLSWAALTSSIWASLNSGSWASMVQ